MKFEWVVIAEGKNVLDVRVFHESREKEARSVYAEYLVKYPDANVTIEKVK